MTIAKTIRSAAFRTWFRLSRPMTLGVRGVVENVDGKILLVRHTYVDGLFLPGGGVEKAEASHESLRRELLEEAGVQLTGEARLHGIYSNHRVFPNDHIILYRVSCWEQVEPTSQGEIAEIAWVNPLAPPADVTPGTGRRLAELYGSAPSSAYW